MLREFISSSSGLAPMRQGLGLGWVISVLSGVAILLGSPTKAEAWTCSHTCPHKAPNDSCSTECDTGELCRKDCFGGTCNVQCFSNG